MNKQVEQIRAEIERLKKDNNGSPLAVCNDLLSFIDSMQKKPKCMYSKDNFTDEDRKVLCEGCVEGCEHNSRKEKPVSEDLETEIRRYFALWYDNESGGCIKPDRWLNNLEDCMDIARHFTNWQKHQMMEDTIDAFIDKGSIKLRQWPLDEKYGRNRDKVKLIIIKED